MRCRYRFSKRQQMCRRCGGRFHWAASGRRFGRFIFIIGWSITSITEERIEDCCSSTIFTTSFTCFLIAAVRYAVVRQWLVHLIDKVELLLHPLQVFCLSVSILRIIEW